MRLFKLFGSKGDATQGAAPASRDELAARAATFTRPVPKRFVVLDRDGLPDAFYSDDIHAAIPNGAVQITEDQYREWHRDAHPRGLKLVDGRLTPHRPEGQEI